MHSTNTLGDAPPFADIITFGGAVDACAAAPADPVPRETGEEEGRVTNQAEAEPGTGPMPRLNSGARRALAEELFTANYPKLAGWVRRLVDDDDTAHEIASEAFVRLLSRTSLRKLDNPQSYLFMIATNLVRDHWRKTERERRAMRSVTAGADREPGYDPAQDVHVRSLIQDLPPRLRDPFLLHYYAGFGLREISLLLRRPEGTIKADLHHARARLRQALTPGASDAR